MWQVLDSHSLVAVYGFVILTPVITSLFIMKFITWWKFR